MSEPTWAGTNLIFLFPELQWLDRPGPGLELHQHLSQTSEISPSNPQWFLHLNPTLDPPNNLKSSKKVNLDLCMLQSRTEPEGQSVPLRSCPLTSWCILLWTDLLLESWMASWHWVTGETSRRAKPLQQSQRLLNILRHQELVMPSPCWHGNKIWFKTGLWLQVNIFSTLGSGVEKSHWGGGICEDWFLAK